MTTQNIGLFKAIGAKMDYLNLRQRVIAENVSNADTPGYRPRDLKPVDFGAVLESVNKSHGRGVQHVALETTTSGHIGHAAGNESTQARKQRETYEVAPEGNAVIMEEQLMKAGQTVMDYNLMTNIYQKQVGLLRTAIGQGGR